ncbi:MAG: hypothetical protein ABIH46_12560, partial [Chloroflexota bacterium]
MPNYDRLTALACLAAVGLGCYLILELQRWWLLPLCVAVGLGTWLVVKQHPGLPQVGRALPFMFVPLPALLVLAAGLSLEPVLHRDWVIPGAVAVGIAL